MTPDRTVALVGRPNVGKSRLFNRLARRRIAIVHDQPGVTRDVNAVDVPELGCTLMDTGGIGLTEQRWDKTQTPDLIAAAEEQVFVALNAAQHVLFVVDAQEGLTTLDQWIADKLRSEGRSVHLVVNKVDDDRHEPLADEFASLGFSDSYIVSAEHDRGMGELASGLKEILGPPPPKSEEELAPDKRRIKLAFIGRPNVGKSSLCNRLLDDDRLVVSEVPGTTRDSIELDLDYTGKDGTVLPFRLMDTAGLRKKKKFNSPIEYFASLRSTSAVEEADVVFLIIDSQDGITLMDKNLASYAVERGRPVAVIVNKWDHAMDMFAKEPLRGYENIDEFRKAFESAARRELFSLPGAPVVFVSAKTGYSLSRLLRTARQLDEICGRKLSTPAINRLIEDMMRAREPKSEKGKRFKVYYSVQTSSRPLRIRMFCNQTSRLEDPYKRYLSKGFIEKFDLAGCPVLFDLVGKPRRETPGSKPMTRQNSKRPSTRKFAKKKTAKKGATGKRPAKRPPGRKK